MITPKYEGQPRRRKSRSGFTPLQKQQIRVRDESVCSWHGPSCRMPLTEHHRANRGSGGRKSADVVSNGLLVCEYANGLMESDPAWAREAKKRGIKISTFADVGSVPVLYWDGHWYRLYETGRYLLLSDEAAELRALYGMEGS